MFALPAAGFAQACDLKIDGKTCKVSVVSCDIKYTPDGAAAGANALACEGVHIVIGPVGSVEIAAVKPVMLEVPNDQTGTDVSGVDSKAYEANGVKASTEFHQRGTTNFAPIITRALAGHPDAVDTASSAPGDAGVIAKQRRLAGFTGPIGRVGGPGTTEILRVCGGLEVLKDFYWYEAVPTDDPKVQAMDEEFRKLVGRDPVGGTTFWSYLPDARMTMKAIQASGTADPGKVAAVPRKMAVEDPNIGKGYWTGKTYYGIQQTLFFPFGVGIIKDGKNLGVERQEAQAED